MDRRNFIKLSGSAAAAGTAVTMTAASANAHEYETAKVALEKSTSRARPDASFSTAVQPIKLALPGRAAIELVTEPAIRFRAHVAALTGQAIRLSENAREIEAAAAANELGQADPIRDAENDAVLFATGGLLSAQRPALTIFDGVPLAGTLTREIASAWMTSLGGAAHLDRISADVGYKILPIAMLGGSRFLMAVDGAALRNTPPQSGPIGLGANGAIVDQAFGRRTGPVATIWAGLSDTDVSAVGGGLPTRRSHDLGMHLTGPVIAAHIPAAIWNGFTPDQQTAIKAAADLTRYEMLSHRQVFEREVAPSLRAALPTPRPLTDWSSTSDMTARVRQTHEDLIQADRDALVLLSPMVRLTEAPQPRPLA